MDEKYLELFIDEANEHIDDLNRSLLELEQDPDNIETINEIFRVAHTLKSSAGFVGLEYLSRLAHKMEDLLQLIKEKKIAVNVEVINLLFSCLDAIKIAVSNVQNNKGEDKETLNLLVANIQTYIEQNKNNFTSKLVENKIEQNQNLNEEKDKDKEETVVTEKKEIIDKKKDNDIQEIKLEFTEKDKENLTQLLSISDKVYYGSIALDPEAPMKNLRLLLIFNRLNKYVKFYKLFPEYSVLEKNPNIDKLFFIIYGKISKDEIMKLCHIDLVEEIYLKEISVNLPAGQEEVSNIVKDVRSNKLKQSKIEIDASESVIKSKNIKVSSEKIDYILNNVGELVITNSGLQKIYEDLTEEFGESQTLSDLKSKIDQAIRIARELQSGIMKMRMMPVGIVFQRFFRPVRDLSLGLGKKLELKIIGEETELDKNIIDSLNDPLMHLIRNAIDHGIESPEERIKKGKPEYGTIILKSYQSGNHIFIEIQDDGRGLDKEKILNKAKSLGIAKENQQYDDQEIYEFIFYPGFSTAEQISNVSGRGVGMNIVKQVVDEFKGGIQIKTEPDKGTSFILMFPLTLAIISTIHVKISNEEYAFPLSDVVETIRIAPSQITVLQGRNIINLRKEIVPIYELSVLMGLPSKINFINENKETQLKEETLENENLEQEKEFPVIITSVGNKKIGYIVDQMIGKKEIVIKSLEQNYKAIPGLIGACLLGDGSIVMVLDVNGLLELAVKNYEDRLSINNKNIEILNAIENYNRKVYELSMLAKKTKKRINKIKGNHSEQNENNNKKDIQKKEDKIEVVYKVLSTSNIEKNENLINSTENNTLIADNAKQNNTIVLDIEQDQDKEEYYLLSEYKKDLERRKQIGLEVFKDNFVPENKNLDKPIFIEEERKIFLSEKDYEKLYSIINSGMINAGLVLTQLLGITIDVSVPEFKTINFKDIIDILDNITYYSIFLETTGEFESLLCLTFDENTAIFTAGELMGLPEEHRIKEKMDIEDIKSVLNELTNIVGSSILNEIANRTQMSIKPSVPEFHILNRNELLKLVENKKHPKSDEKLIYISADFLRDETELLGKVFLIPSRPHLIQLLQKLKI